MRMVLAEASDDTSDAPNVEGTTATTRMNSAPGSVGAVKASESVDAI